MTERPENLSNSSNQKKYILTEEKKKALEELRQFAKRIRQTPPEKRFPISNPDKYSFPIGMDDDGNLKRVKEKEDQQ